MKRLLFLLLFPVLTYGQTVVNSGILSTPTGKAMHLRATQDSVIFDSSTYFKKVAKFDTSIIMEVPNGVNTVTLKAAGPGTPAMNNRTLVIPWTGQTSDTVMTMSGTNLTASNGTVSTVQNPNFTQSVSINGRRTAYDSTMGLVYYDSVGKPNRVDISPRGVPNEQNDISDEINAAYALLTATGGGDIYLPAGRFSIGSADTALQFYTSGANLSGIRLIGRGKGHYDIRVTTDSSGTDLYYYGDGVAMAIGTFPIVYPPVYQTPEIYVGGFRILHAGSARVGLKGIIASTVRRSVFENIAVSDFQVGYRFENISDFNSFHRVDTRDCDTAFIGYREFNGSKFTECDFAAVDVVTSSAAKLSKIIRHQNRFGLLIDMQSSGGVIQNCRFHNFDSTDGHWAIRISRSWGWNVIGNYFEACGTAIRIAAGTDANCSGIEIRGNYAISLNDSGKFVHTGQPGDGVHYVSGVNISGNILEQQHLQYYKSYADTSDTSNLVWLDSVKVWGALFEGNDEAIIMGGNAWEADNITPEYHNVRSTKNGVFFEPQAGGEGTQNIVILNNNRGGWGLDLKADTLAGDPGELGHNDSIRVWVSTRMGHKYMQMGVYSDSFWLSRWRGRTALISGSYNNGLNIEAQGQTIEFRNRTNMDSITFRLDSSGNVMAYNDLTVDDTLKLPTGAGNGKVLTSDSAGAASWQTLSTDTTLGSDTLATKAYARSVGSVTDMLDTAAVLTRSLIGTSTGTDTTELLTPEGGRLVLNANSIWHFRYYAVHIDTGGTNLSGKFGTGEIVNQGGTMDISLSAQTNMGSWNNTGAEGLIVDVDQTNKSLRMRAYCHAGKIYRWRVRVDIVKANHAF